MVLALLGTSFAVMQQVERQVARNYLDGVRARLIARAGIEDGVTRLKQIFPERAFAAGNKAWMYHGNSLDETSQDLTVPLHRAKNPSFAFESENVQNPTDANVTPKLVDVDGQLVGFTANMEHSTYGVNADHYALKITDLSGCIHINDGLEHGPNGSVSQNLRRILNVLGQVQQVANLGNRILDNRPAGGYGSRQDLQRFLTDVEYTRVVDYLTAKAWIDRNVANPVPLSQAMAAQYPVNYWRGTPPLYRLGKGKDALGNLINTDLQFCPPAQHTDDAIRIYGLDQLNPQWIEIVGRAPVNVNSAARPVLVALLADLRGFFVGDRRRNNPRWSGDLYLSFKQQNSLSPAGTEGDEIGFLFQTVPIVGPGSTVSVGISATSIADEILACRERRVSPNPPNVDYAAVPWSGPFRTWRQWNRFCDHMVEINLLRDERQLWYDFHPSNCDASGYGPLVPSDFQRKHAARAIADVLKANFNPNLHLNELNPDENLYTRVDKTDLVVNSTEFCFMPTGVFEVQSLGRVLRPEIVRATVVTGRHELTAQAMVTAVVKLYDLYRETNQKQFYGGTCANRVPSPGNNFETNNNKSVETGPEPDNGTAPSQNEWDGYVTLPTIGGNFHNNPNQSKPANALWTTMQVGNQSQFESALHTHFTWDFNLHHHTFAGCRHEIASTSQPDETVENFPDWPTSVAGPYDPTDSGGNVHRLAKSFRIQQGSTNPGLAPFAPSDLRLDGGYSERNAAPCYVASHGSQYLWRFSDEQPRGMVSFWFKPSFYPELTGKVRTLWDMSRYHTPCAQDVYVYPFACWFFPAHYTSSIAEVNQPWYWHNNIGKFHPASLAYGSKAWHNVPSGHSFGNLTKSLNHAGHADDNPNMSPLQAHRWINISFWWGLRHPKLMEPEYGGMNSELYVNGSKMHVPYTFSSMTGWPSGGDRMWYFEGHDGGDRNHIRLGAPSKIGNAPGLPFRGNHTNDCTMDEFYVWQREDQASPLTTWIRGRYYKPMNQYQNEGQFTSQQFALRPCQPRALAPPSSAVPPTGTVPATPAGAPNAALYVPPGTTMSGPATAAMPAVRVLGLSWTWYGESHDENLVPTLDDYNTPGGTEPEDVQPRLELCVKADGVTYAYVSNDAFSATGTPLNAAIPVVNWQQVQYMARFRLLQANASTILLAAPVLDDVTVYYDCGHIEYLSYVAEVRVLS
jgi:hypothetical protein